VKISSWLDTISSESRKRENRMDFHFVLSLLFIASFAFVLQRHRAKLIPLCRAGVYSRRILDSRRSSRREQAPALRCTTIISQIGRENKSDIPTPSE